MNQLSHAYSWTGRNIPPTREAIENEIERLIALLDATDGDCDLEDGGDDEASLGSTPIYGEYNLELDTSDDEPNGDEEHELGWSNPLGLRVHVPDELKQLREDGLIQ